MRVLLIHNYLPPKNENSFAGWADDGRIVTYA